MIDMTDVEGLQIDDWTFLGHFNGSNFLQKIPQLGNPSGQPRPPIPAGVQVWKWTHSILEDPTFRNEWKAIESARALAFELDVSMGST